MKFIFFALAKTGEGISGGDRIFIELAKRIGKKYPIEVFTSREGIKLCQDHNISAKKLKITLIDNSLLQHFFFLDYFYKIILGIRLGFSLKLSTTDQQQRNTYLYSASEFWMDSLPAVIVKLRYPNSKWIAAWYQSAPNPLVGFKETGRENSYRLSALMYWLMQLPIKPLINKWANDVIVNNENERNKFPKMEKAKKVKVLIGAVPLEEIKRYLTSHNSQPAAKKYEAVFQGRFHPQKGVVELIDIWRKVVDKMPNAKLAMIGDGPLRKNVESRIRNLVLENNVKLFGYVFDGPEKYKIFSQSKIVVHPAFYDSGGMASAEAMAFGLPCIGFDLKSYDSYYPAGMVKVKKGDVEAFADAIIKLLSDTEFLNKIARDAEAMVESNWSWNNRASEFIKDIL